MATNAKADRRSARLAARVRAATERAEKGYNGWANYETWNVALWLDNDRAIYERCRDMAAECKERAANHPNTRDGVWTAEETARFVLADRLKDMVTEEMAPELGASMYADLLGSALQDVEWEDIAEGMLED